MRNLAPLLIIPLLISAGQLLFKQASAATGLVTFNRTTALLTNPYLLAALVIYFASTLWWVIVLRDMPLSRAYGFMAMSFVYVPALSWLLLGEPINARTVLGTLLIVGGLMVIGTSSSQRNHSDQPSQQSHR